MIPRILPQARILPANDTGGADGIGVYHRGVLPALSVTQGCAADVNQESSVQMRGMRIGTGVAGVDVLQRDFRPILGA